MSTSLIYYVAHVYELTEKYLSEAGHILYLSQKITMALKVHTDFTWFTCHNHVAEIQSHLLYLSFKVIVNKYCKDVQENDEIIKKQKKQLQIIKKLGSYNLKLDLRFL